MDTVIRDDKLARTPGTCCVSWSAIIAGALVAFSLSALLNLLNAGLGLVAFPESFRALTGVTAAGYIWLVICGIIAMFLAGWVAGKIVRHYAGACYGALHGFLAWSLALLLTVYLAAHFAHASADAADRTTVDNRVEATRIIDQHDAARAEQAADVAGGITLGIFFIFLIGAAAATAGGYVGSKNGPMTTTKY